MQHACQGNMINEKKYKTRYEPIMMLHDLSVNIFSEHRLFKSNKKHCIL
jgi:hypothetical protein